MKTVILSFITFFMLLAGLSGQWEIINDASDAINTIDFINDSISWMGGNNGYLVKTLDGGMVWKDISLSVKRNFGSIDFINDTLGWAICADSILKSTDGGMNWVVQDGMKAKMLSIIDDQMVYAITSFSAYKTTNGGLNWTDISPLDISRLENLYCINRDIGILIGSIKVNGKMSGIILRTFNGGMTWETKIVEPFFNPVNIQFLNDSTGFFIVDGKIWETKDTFNTWSIKAGFTDSICFISAFHFFDSSHVIAVIDNQLYKSYDGGISWAEIENNFNRRIIYSSIHCPDENNCFILTPGQTLLQSTDQGNSWSILKDFFYKLYDVCFIDRNKGFIACGERFVHMRWRNVYVTDDGGQTWNIFDSQAVEDMETSLDQLPEFYFFKKNSNVFETIYSELSQHCFKLYQIANGDESWLEMCSVNIYETDNRSIFLIDEYTGWVVGNGGLIFKHSPTGIWENNASGTDLPLNKVFFIDSNTGWIAGGYHNNNGFKHIFLITTDDGESWAINSQLDYLINDFYFVNSQHGWAVAEDKNYRGVIIETTDGGNNWNVVIDSLSAPLKAICFKDGCGWAVGDRLILKLKYSKFWISGVTLNNAPYVAPGVDTVCISAMISNPDNCPLKISSVIKSQDGAIHDTIKMLNQGDELWNGYWPVANGERFYTVDLILTQTDTTNENDTLLIDSRFTTSGPLAIQNVLITTSDTLPNPGDNLYLSLRIKNEGLLNTITNIKAMLIVPDTFVTVNSDWKNFTDIPPGELSHPGEWKLTISEDCPYRIKIPIKVDIASNSYVYWNDTISILVEKPSNINEENTSLPKIYPNPARYIVNIEFPATGVRQIMVELYNMTGILIYEKQYKTNNANTVEKIDLSDIPVGMYFVRVMQEQDVRIVKLIVY